MTYKGKVDWSIGLAIVVGVCIPVGSAILLHLYWLLAGPVSLVLLITIFVYPQTYETAGDAFYIRAGLTKRSIPWGEISSVSPSSNSRSSLALSMDRVLVEYARGSILIAPDYQARFFDDVASHCPQLSRRGFNLVIAMK